MLFPVELFVALLVAPAIIGVVFSVFPRSRCAKAASLIACSISCIAGILTFFVMGPQPDTSYVFRVSSAFGTYNLEFDPLSSLMMSFSSFVFLMVLIHLVRSGNRYSPGYMGLMNLLFMSCMLAMCADSVMILLISWELITLTTFLMLSGADETSRWRYFTITHFGGLIIMAVFIAMWYATGTTVLSEMGGVISAVGETVAGVMIFLLFIGFGTKLGMVPFHVWMPDLYDSAPMHTVTLLSTVCSNVAVLILIKSTFLWIGVPDSYVLSMAIIALASVSAIWGAMESLVRIKPRVILAYSGMENMSMIVLCLAIGMIFLKLDFDNSLFIMILVAAILHTINHSFFKSLMLLSLGTVENSTGVHTMERMGGLAKVLPLLSVFAIIGTASMAAVPPMNGFVSEWLMIKTVIDAGVGDSVINIVLPLIVAVLGICGTMAAVSYVRLYGFMFLGRPRSAAAAEPGRISPSSMVPLGVLSCACIALGVLSIPVIYTIIDSMRKTLAITYEIENIIADSFHPVAISAVLIAVCLILYALFRVFRRGSRSVKTWGCGTDLDDNMQYSPSGFTQPLVHVFHPLYGDVSELIENDSGSTRTYNVHFKDPFTKYVMRPIGRGVLSLSERIGRIQNGNIQSYLGYIMIALIVTLLGVRFI